MEGDTTDTRTCYKNWVYVTWTRKWNFKIQFLNLALGGPQNKWVCKTSLLGMIEILKPKISKP